MQRPRFINFHLLSSVLIIASILAGCASKPAADLATVQRVDLQRYSGTWYEIARYENRFEKGCTAATATYAIRDEYIQVTNRCHRDGMLVDSAAGKAYSTDHPRNSKLEVTFFWPFYGDYWVLSLPDDYRYSVVGDPQRKYFWILARKPVIDEEDKKTILSEMPRWGYDPARLFWTDPRALANIQDQH